MQGCLKINGKVFQVAVVNAHQERITIQGDVQFLSVVNFNQVRHAELYCQNMQLEKQGRLQSCNDQQNGVGASAASFVDLIWVKDEIFAQERHLVTRRLAFLQLRGNLAQVVQMTFKIAFISQHANGSSAVFGIHFRQAQWVEIGCQE